METLQTINQLRQAITAYCESVDVLPVSRETYRRELLEFCRYCERHGITAINELVALDYKRSLTLKPNTINNYIVALKGLCRWVGSPAADALRLERRQQGHRKDALDDNQISALLKTCHKPRDRAIISLMLCCGLRCISISKIDGEDIKVSGDQVTLKVWTKGHTGKDVEIPLTGMVLTALQEHIITTGALFVNKNGSRLSPGAVSKIVKTCLRAAGLDSLRISAHSLRHTAITGYYRISKDVFATQVFAGHATPATTQAYVHIDETLQDETRKQLTNKFETLIPKQEVC